MEVATADGAQEEVEDVSSKLKIILRLKQNTKNIFLKNSDSGGNGGWSSGGGGDDWAGW